MTETAEQYRMRLASYVEGQDPIALQREAPGTIARLIEGVPEAMLKERRIAGKWSVIEILMHLAEDELVGSWRYRQILEHDTPELAGFDQDLWARLGDYASCRPEDALTLFRLLREANVKMLSRLSPQQWRRSGLHSERGKIMVLDLCRHMAAHDVNHIDQIRTILRCKQ
jgi:hypothetical protein